MDVTFSETLQSVSDQGSLYILFSLLLFLFNVFVWLKFNRLRYGDGINLPPGKMGWPVFGETKEFLTNIYAFVKRRRSKYGEIFKTSIFGCPTVISTDLGLNRFLLMNEMSRGLVTGYPKAMMELMGKWNIIAVEKDLHRRMRGALLSLINVGTFKDHLLAEIDDFVGSYLSNLNGQTIHLHQKMRDMTFYFWVKKVISLQIGSAETEAFKTDYYELADGILSIPLNLPGGQYRKSLQSRKRIQAKLGGILRQRRQLSRDFHDDLLAEVLNAEINGTVKTKLTDEEILDFLTGIIFSGHETTSNTATVAIKFLHDCHRALQDLRLEHQTIVSRKKAEDRSLSWDDYQSMLFTRRIIQETIRVGNIAPATLRKTTADMEIGGYKIPKGWTMVLCTTETAENTTNPFQFNPWKQEDGKLMPFGEGMRMCAGKDFAMVELCVFLHHFVTRFEWKEIESNEKTRIFSWIEPSKKLHVKVWDLVNEVNDVQQC